ncbi:hypothetical protein ABZ297_13500 [Nonomuraea sp. NPDC005983]|uniref:hypothetical protein n=1 Tax=Nonomuraea sp. NPDC005983 TaxID=3155595 RepID=UPI0033A306E0
MQSVEGGAVTGSPGGSVHDRIYQGRPAFGHVDEDVLRRLDTAVGLLGWAEDHLDRPVVDAGVEHLVADAFHIDEDVSVSDSIW